MWHVVAELINQTSTNPSLPSTIFVASLYKIFPSSKVLSTQLCVFDGSNYFPFMFFYTLPL